MNLRVLGNRVLIRPHIASAMELPAGLIAPDNFIPECATTGEVVGIGLGFAHPGFENPEALLGQSVCFSPADGQEIEFKREALLILKAEELLGLFQE